MYELNNKTTLITGGTSGIGKSLAEHFAQNNSKIIILDIDTDGEKVAKSLNGDFYHADLSKQVETENIINQIKKDHKKIDILINNAGFQKVEKIENYDNEVWNSMIQIMLTTPFQLIKHLLPNMKINKWGRVINISSIHGLVASPFKSAYISAKHGLIGLTKTIALEVGEYGITSNAICPAYVKTNMTEKQIADQAKILNIKESEFIEKIALGPAAIKSLIEPDEIANLALFLASDKASKITGSSYTIDLGWTAK
ncbi:MAG: D-beta-hydroxybutyrate dehydrogenase [Chloroflexi bacterium]|jgi:3-hydroxybutyrate dehydrogenase|nr:D-beta-hydroxybutyrate dehydrogenase [Chloroflexota bacterium]MCH2305077.1 3-hydroxybutyrate dehydrogenase [SAR202 cluster bacterium]|tara:strand:+ start:5081 stop:5845 length:765 start_codon:yes stop_codon:yes gene_type:complete